MTEFTLNLSINKLRGYAPFKLIYGHMPQMTVLLPPTNLPGIESFAQHTLDCLQGTHNAIIKSWVDQLVQANKHRWEDSPKLKKGELAYISTKNLSLPKGWVNKLLPKYIGLYEIIEVFLNSSNYALKLPPELEWWGIFPKSQVSWLAPHEPNNSIMFPGWAAWIFYDFGDDPKQEYQVSEIINHGWDMDNCLWFHVKLGLGDLMWEPLTNMNELVVLDDYLILQNVQNIENLWKVWIPPEDNSVPIIDLPRSAWVWKPSAKLHMQVMLKPAKGHLWH